VASIIDDDDDVTVWRRRRRRRRRRRYGTRRAKKRWNIDSSNIEEEVAYEGEKYPKTKQAA